MNVRVMMGIMNDAISFFNSLELSIEVIIYTLIASMLIFRLYSLTLKPFKMLHNYNQHALIFKGVKLILICFLFLLPVLQYGQDELPRHSKNVDMTFDKNTDLSKNGSNVISKTITEKGATWLRLFFTDVQLDKNSSITITSVLDGASQVLKAETLNEWNNSSAYFNGDSVIVTLNSDSSKILDSFKIHELSIGESTTKNPESICGPNDDRVSSSDRAIGRIVPIGCTGWIVSNGKLVTSGHCVGSRAQIIEFNVPKSNTNGSIVHPSPQDQYPIGNFVSPYPGSPSQVNDWAVFTASSNSVTGLTPIQAQGKAFNVVRNNPGNTIRISGFGTDSGRDNQSQQTHTGPLSSVNNSFVRYSTDTTGGNSGSPIVDEATGSAVGVHGYGGCSSSGGSNMGIRATVTGFWNALGLSNSGTRYPISWTDAVNVSVNQNNLTKTSNTGWNAGAASTNVIPANRDGFIEMTVGNPSTDVMFGLSYSNTNASWNTLDFNLYMSRFRGGNIVIFQRGTQITSNSELGKYNRGDVVRVERKGSVVNFKRNGNILYSLPVDRSRSLIADVALYDKNSQVLKAYCSAPAPNRYPISWTDAVNVSVNQNNLTKTSGTGWNGGAASINRIPANQDGYIEMTIGNASTDVMFGLSYSNTNATWNTIDFNLYMSRFRGGNIVIFQRANQITSNSELGKYAQGDIVRVERKGSVVNFIKNGSVLYSLPVDRSRSMIADVALYDKNSQVLKAYCSAPALRSTNEDLAEEEETFVKVKTIDEIEKVILSPNPASTTTSLMINSKMNAQLGMIIYGAHGKTLIQKQIFIKSGTNQIDVDVSNFPKGLYMVQLIYSDGSHKSVKLVRK